jgi:VWFA-related protein
VNLKPLLLTALLVPAPLSSSAAAQGPSAAAVRELPVLILDRQGEAPRTVGAGDLSVIENGKPWPVVSLAPIGQPWRIVIWADRVLSGSRTLRAAAGTLAEQARALAALGTVEVVVAEPQPRVALAPTRDVQAIDEALSKLWLESEGRDDLRALRRRFRDERPEKEEGSEPGARAAAAIDAEVHVVRRQQDAFVEWLLAQGSGGPRAVFLVSDGYDVDPAKFYRTTLLSPGEKPPAGVLETTGLETARTVAALGWTAIPVPMGDSTLPDLRRVKPHSTLKAPIGGTITLDRRREPPPDQPAPPPALLAPQQPLTWLAEATGGEMVLQASALAGALVHLRSRSSLRWEAPLATDGRPLPLEVTTSRPDLVVKARRWDVAGIPEAVGASRAAHLLADEEEGLGLEISARLQPALAEVTATPASPAPSGAERKAILDLRVESPKLPTGPLRVTVAGLSGGAAFHHLLDAADRAGTDPGVYHLAIPLPEGDVVAVLLEPLNGGPWGGQVVSLAPPLPEADAVLNIRSGIRLIPPTGAALTGKVRLRVNGEGTGIARVEVKLEGRRAATCATVPCDAELDLGRRVRPQVVQGIAYDAAGKVLAHDAVRLNEPPGTFGVRIVEPASRRGVGTVNVEADVRVPAGRRIEKVELYWNDELAATLYEPPFRYPVKVPRQRAEGYLRAAAMLDDGSTAEDAITLNASDLGARIDVRLIQLAVVVTDAGGKPVPGLPKDAFQVRQDGEPQEIAAFENAGELPLTLALAIDSSASMFLKLPDVRKAVASLLDTGLTSRDRAMLIDFDSKARLVRPVTRDLAAVSAALDQLQPDGGTALWDAITFSLGQLRGISGRKALVIYSDGIDEAEHAAFPACLKAARESGVPIYLIVSNPREERGDDGGFLTEPAAAKFERLAQAGGGQVYFIHPNQDLARVYGTILSELRSQYTVAFYPKDTAPPAAWSKIDVAVTGRPGLTARTVSGVSARP